MANRAAFLEAEKGSFAVRDTEIGEPGEKEVLIKVRNKHLQLVGCKASSNIFARSTLLPFSLQMQK